MIGKFKQNDACDWCGVTPASVVHIATRRTKGVTWKVEAMACDTCKRRLEEQQDD